MTFDRPNFIDSEFFVGEVNNWHLKPDAPEDVKKEFLEFMESMKENELNK